MPEPDPSAAGTSPAFDPLTDGGAAELRRRIEQAPPRPVPRAELDGHVGLSSRELYELGVTFAPVGLRGVPSAVGGRLLVVVGAVIGTLLLAMAAAALLDPLFGELFGEEVLRETVDRGLESGAGLGAIFGFAGAAGIAAERFAVRRVRRGVMVRRRATAGTAAPAADDPEARATVAVVREPGALRVSLLWARGHAEDAALLEVRSLEEERVPDDDPGRAEDVVGRLAEVALRADAGRTVAWPRDDGRPAGPATARDARRDDRALVAAARADLPAVDPREPVGPGWDPEPLTDAGHAELAARLVRARPLLWNPAALERVAVDPRDPRGHRPPQWPAEAERRAPLAPAIPKGVRRRRLGTAWFALFVAMVVFGGISRADVPATNRIIGYPAVALAVALILGLRWRERRAPGQRLRRSVLDAARVPGRALERGVPGPGGRVLVLHGTHEGRDRLELVHARAAPDDGKGRLQVRTLAWRVLTPDDVEEPREVVQELWAIADDAGFVTRRGEQDAGTVQRINTALGRAAERRRAAALGREPLAWAAGVLLGVFGLILLVQVVTGGSEADPGLAMDLCLTLWPLAAAVVLWRAARRVRDPVED
ncbi:hypothetical protein [Patulibacter americanus]|uniref:hypothetical protein n=1 Tax=Patulibacter americanus TaxID=588672 RepID=UPI0003B32DE6|nr:hypothetical protein [Patulibacter americanus]